MYNSRFGSSVYAGREYGRSGAGRGLKVACLNDMSDHGGHIVTTNDDNLLSAKGELVAVEGALHWCPIWLHGITSITAITTHTYHNGELILTEGAVAGCGATIYPIDRQVDVEA